MRPRLPSHQQPESDAELVSLVAACDVEALGVVYDRHAAAVLGLARRITGDSALAEDVAQEAFLSFWRNSHLYRADRGSVRAWVLGITRHRAIDALRRRGSRARAEAAEATLVERLPGGERTDSAVVRRDEARSARAALDTLPGEQRRAIELSYFGGLSHVEIAGRVGLPLGTVKSRIRLGLEKLREALDPSPG